jgi:hypothetical protein
MDTNIKNDEYEKCWNKHIVLLDKCIPSGASGTLGTDFSDIEVCYEIFKKNFQECVGVNKIVSNSLYFNKIVK